MLTEYCGDWSGVCNGQTTKLTKFGQKFLAVLIDPPYANEFSSGAPGARGVTVNDLVIHPTLDYFQKT